MNSVSPLIFVSTTAFGSDVSRAVAVAREHNLPLEFGSAVPHEPSLGESYKNLTLPRLPHNYFPAPADDFVLNLASSDPEIFQRSCAHCVQGLELAADSGAPFYAAHAGFCIDPDPAQLGSQWDISISYDANNSYQTFCTAVRQLGDQAVQENVDFLVENNVVEPSNVDAEGETPLLCTRPGEIKPLFQDVDHPQVGLLLDTGHLKVTAHTFAFDLDEAVERIKPYVRGIHHSDNDGQSDTNSPIDEDYWFLPHLSHFDHVPHVLEVKNQSTRSILRQIDLLERHLSNDL